MHLLKGKDMTTEAKAALVNKGVDLCAKAEKHLDAAYAAILALRTIPKEARDLGMIGFLESEHLQAQIAAAAGKSADAKADVLAFHRRGTDVAVKHDVDVPQPRDGGGGR